MTTPALSDLALLRINSVLEIFPVCRTQWYEGIKAGIYPAPVKLGKGRASAWRASDIRALLASYGPAANDAEA